MQKNTRNLLYVILGVAFGVSFALGDSKPTISVSIAPQAYFVEKIAKDTANIHILIPPNSDEHSLDFKPSAIAKLQKSAVYFTIGLEMDSVLRQKFSSVKIIDISKGIEKIQDLHKDSHTHDSKNTHTLHDNDSSKSHRHDSKHESHSDANERKDPHIWLDPILVKKIARNIADELSKIYPQNTSFYTKNLADFEAECDSLHSQISAILSQSKGKKFIIYHPSLSYFATRYHLIQMPVEILGKEPKARDLQALINLAKKEQIKVIFTQIGFTKNAAKSLANEIGANVIELNHLSKEWDKEMLKIAHQIAQN